MPREGFEPTTPATKRPHTYALDLAATGIGHVMQITTAELAAQCGRPQWPLGGTRALAASFVSSHHAQGIEICLHLSVLRCVILLVRLKWSVW
jgi:hypothetical protein